MSSIRDLKCQLADEKEQEKRIELNSRIEELEYSAEKSIRKHQREISFETKEYTVELTVNKYKDGIEEHQNELFVPDYQRDFVWDKKKQSRLIESILIGLPVPYIFIADVEDSEDIKSDGRTEIVDGSQRIRTLYAFLEDRLELDNLELLEELNGFKYSDLPKSRQRRFNRSPIRIIELGTCTEATRRDLFERINTGSDILLDMEVRRGSKAADSDLYKNVIKPCSTSETFIKLAPMSETKEKRGEREEFTLRFFAYFEKYEKFDHSVKEFLNQYLKENEDLETKKIDFLLSIFDKTMRFVDKYFDYGFRKSKNAKSTPRVRFESLGVGVALALIENENIAPKNIDDWLFSDEFKTLTTSDGANSRVKVKERIEYVRDNLLDE